MSEPNDETTSYINTFMNRILIGPLASIMEAVAEGETVTALSKMRCYIMALPPGVNADLKHYVEKIDEVFSGMHTAQARNSGNPVLGINYMNFMGPGLMRRIYDQLMPLIYDQKLFEALKGTPYELVGQGPTKFGD